MKKYYNEGDVIADGDDPHKDFFVCGSISSVGAEGYLVKTLGGHAKIFFEAAVPLEDVVRHCPDILLVADKASWEEKGVFIGGVVISQDDTDEKYCIRMSPNGCGYIPYSKSIKAGEISFRK